MTGPPDRPAGPRRTAVERQPKYLRIYTELRDRIASGAWPAGSPLPAQRELADEFGVSMMTLRQAVQLLADEGLVAARPGLGTYVTPQYAHDLGQLRGFGADLARPGAEVSSQLLASSVAVPPGPVAARLGSPAQALHLRRLRLVAGRPVILQTSWLPVPLPGGLDPRTLITRPAEPAEPAAPAEPAGPLARAGAGLYQALAEHGLAVARATETITPVLLDPEAARDLGRPAGSLALLSHRVSFTAAGDPVIDDHAVLPGDSVAITATRSAGEIAVAYTLTPPPASGGIG